MDWTPLTIMTTRVPAVLKRCKSAQHWTPDRNAKSAVSKYDGHDRHGISQVALVKNVLGLGKIFKNKREKMTNSVKFAKFRVEFSQINWTEIVLE